MGLDYKPSNFVSGVASDDEKNIKVGYGRRKMY